MKFTLGHSNRHLLFEEFLGEGVCRVSLRSHRRAQRAIVAVVEWEVIEQTEREVGL